jgi:hypothetical protein
MLKHVHSPVAFSAILCAIIVGLLQLNLWAVCGCASVLAIVSLTASTGSFSRYGQVGSAISVSTIMLSTTLNATAASSSAYITGRAIGWLWGI